MQVVQQTKNMMHQAEEAVQEATQSMTDCVKDHPLSSVAVVVGAGIGVGILVSMMLNSRREQDYASQARRIGERIMSGVESIVPQSWMDRISR